MATIVERGNAWQAKVRRKGWPTQTRTFDRFEDAQKWARAVEREMDVGAFIPRDEAERTTFEQAANRFEREVLPSKRSGGHDAYRLARLVERFGKYSLAAISASMLATYRDERLKVVSPQTVVHDLNLMFRVFKACSLDWGIPLPHGIPTAMVRKPRLNNERDRRLSPVEESYLLDALADPAGKTATGKWTPNRSVLPIFTLALETAARQSELLSLDWQMVDLERGVARLRGVDGRATKNSDPYRDVPLSARAAQVLNDLAPQDKRKGRVFPTTASGLRQSWERAVARARKAYLHDVLRQRLPALDLDAESEIRALVYKKRRPDAGTVKLLAELEAQDNTLDDLRFHDLRHEATSRLAAIFQMHELMKITGHSSSKMLARYYHPRPEDLTAKLRAGQHQGIAPR